jgi:hypothetical protein
MLNMLRRCKSSWLCMKFEFAFIAGHSIFNRVLLSSFIAMNVNELCHLFRPNPYAISCLMLPFFCIRLPKGFSRFFLAVMKFSYEISCFLQQTFLVRFPDESLCDLCFFAL